MSELLKYGEYSHRQRVALLYQRDTYIVVVSFVFNFLIVLVVTVVFVVLWIIGHSATGHNVLRQ
jgi:hypothetical protein